MTTVIVQYKPTDLLRVALYITLRSSTLRWTLLVLALAVFAINLQQQRSHLTPLSWIAIVLTTGLFTAATLALIVVLTVLSTLLRNRKGSPAAEVHTYSLTDEGMSRRSASSEMLLKWRGVRSLRKSRSAIYVGVSASAYFVLPRHAFASEEDYRSCWDALLKFAPERAP